MTKRRRVDYPHLPQVPDYLDHDLDIVFVGINPGITSSTSGHHYGHAGNLFWRCLRDSGLVEPCITHLDDHRLPMLYRLGLTNLVDRPSRSMDELDKSDYAQGKSILSEKLLEFKPRIVCFVGKGIYEKFMGKKCSKLGLQVPQGFLQNPDIKVYVVPSTSGRVGGYSKEQRIGMFKDLADLVKPWRDSRQVKTEE